MKNPIYELKNTRTEHLAAAQTALDSGDKAQFDAKMAEAKKIGDQIEALEALEAEKGRFTDSQSGAVNLAQAQQNQREEDARASGVDAIRTGPEYARAFAYAVRNGITPKNGAGLEEARPLMAALTESTGTPVGADGGFLVPIDFDNMIHEITRQLIQLSSFFATENVTTLTGWRAIDNVPTKGFTKTDEMANIPKDDQPAFRKVEYAVKKYGLIVPMSSELADDNTAGLLQYLARWFGRKGVITDNTLLLSLLNALTATTIAAGKELDGIKNALNTKLDPDIALNAVLITNQTGFDFMDNVKDTMGRPLLQPDPTNATRTLFKGRQVVMMSDATLPNRVASGTFAPLYIGDFRMFGTLFQRKALEVRSTDIGGNAWGTDSMEVRGITRKDVQTMDNGAAIKLEIKTA